jgi:L-aminopeptidase/D-esterase-like protein
VLSDGVTVGALAAVNSFGSVRLPGTDAFWAWPFEIGGEFGGARPPGDFVLDPEDWGSAKAAGAQLRTNTTLACIAVDAEVSVAEARRIALMATAGLARAIRPVFAPFDGDVVFCLSVGQQRLTGERPIAIARIGEAAATCLARAVARGVFAAGRRDVGLASAPKQGYTADLRKRP